MNLEVRNYEFRVVCRVENKVLPFTYNCLYNQNIDFIVWKNRNIDMGQNVESLIEHQNGAHHWNYSGDVFTVEIIPLQPMFMYYNSQAPKKLNAKSREIFEIYYCHNEQIWCKLTYLIKHEMMARLARHYLWLGGAEDLYQSYFYNYCCNHMERTPTRFGNKFNRYLHFEGTFHLKCLRSPGSEA